MTLIKIRPNLVLGTFGYIRGLFTDQFAPPLGALTIVAVAIAICSLALFGSVDVFGSTALTWSGLMFFAMLLLPAFASGVMPLRPVEPAFLLYAGGAIAGAFPPTPTRQSAVQKAPSAGLGMALRARAVSSLPLVRVVDAAV